MRSEGLAKVRQLAFECGGHVNTELLSEPALGRELENGRRLDLQKLHYFNVNFIYFQYLVINY